MQETTAQIAAFRTGQGWGRGEVRHAAGAGTPAGYQRGGGEGIPCGGGGGGTRGPESIDGVSCRACLASKLGQLERRCISSVSRKSLSPKPALSPSGLKTIDLRGLKHRDALNLPQSKLVNG